MTDQGPVAIVTGGSRGIGAACCRLLAEAGCDVALSYRGNWEAAQNVVRQIEAAGRRGVAVQADMASEAGVLKLFETADRDLGRVDNVVINAGITSTTGAATKVADMTAADIQAVTNLNVVGALLTAREAVRRMSRSAGGRGGAIVILSSVAAELGSPNEYVHYAATKGATNSMTYGLSKEVGPEGIRVNAVAPGVIETDIHAAIGEPDRPRRLGPSIPLGRPGAAEEVADAVLWLLSDAARYVTGTVVKVSGGR